MTVSDGRIHWHRAVTAIAVAVLAAAAAMVPGAAAAPTSAIVFTRAADASTRAVTLTFDADWWSPGDPATVLEILADNGIVAGMGITGRYAERYPDSARQLIRAGHKLINHSYSHPAFSTLTQAQRWDELDRAEAAFRALGLASDGWVRVPFGDGRRHAGVNRDLGLRGYPISFDWTFDTTGYQGATCDEIRRRVRQLTVPGAIIVMHLSSSSTDTRCLQSTIDTLREMGYGFSDPWTAVTSGAHGSHASRSAPSCAVTPGCANARDEARLATLLRAENAGFGSDPLVESLHQPVGRGPAVVSSGTVW